MNPARHPTPVAGLTVCYTCMNNMRTIPASLDSVRALADSIVVLDSGSTDGTIEHFRAHGIETVHRDFTNPTEQKSHAMSLAREARWILLLDSDESLDVHAVESIREALCDCPDSVCGFSLNRVTWLNGRLLEHSFQPEWRLRLVRAGTSRVVGDSVGGHDRLEVDGEVRRLEGRILRFRSTRHMLERGICPVGLPSVRAAVGSTSSSIPRRPSSSS